MKQADIIEPVDKRGMHKRYDKKSIYWGKRKSSYCTIFYMNKIKEKLQKNKDFVER